MGWIILGISILGFVLCYRLVYRAFFDVMDFDIEDPMDRVAGPAISLLTALVWPIVLAGLLLWYITTPKTNQERKAEARKLERRKQQLQIDIREMEETLGVPNEETHWIG